MAKKPQGGMDEEEIIRRRDGVAGPTSDRPLDADAKRALADVRLRALAFALGTEQGTRTGADEAEADERLRAVAFALGIEQGSRTGADEADDSELLAYLLDMLPEQRRMALEEALRGNPGAFGRLMTLRAAFNSQTDQRDLQRADDPAREIRRHTAGRVDIRRRGDILQFRDATRPSPSFVESYAPAPDLTVARATPLPAFQMRQRLERAVKMEDTLRNVLARVRRDLDAGMSLVNETQSSLERWSKIIRREESETSERGAWGDREAEDLRHHMVVTFLKLKDLAGRINEELGAVSMLDLFAKEDPVAASVSMDLVMDLFGAAQLKSRSPPDRKTWTNTFGVEAGPWALHLAGTTAPAPHLAVSLHSNQVGSPSVEPFLTLVRPSEGFEMVNLDSSGSGKIALPPGESVMLLQADEVWEIRLSFRGA
jgi:hypothetical protein